MDPEIEKSFGKSRSKLFLIGNKINKTLRDALVKEKLTNYDFSFTIHNNHISIANVVH